MSEKLLKKTEFSEAGILERIGDGSLIGAEYLPDSIARTADLPTDYEIASAEGRRLIASLKESLGSVVQACFFATTKATAGNMTATGTSTHVQLINADGTYGSPVVNGDALSFPAGGSHRAYGIRPCNAGGALTGTLTEIDVGGHGVTALDVSLVPNLTVIWCEQNQLTTLDVSNSTSLTTLQCEQNQLATLDVSNNTQLYSLLCYHNQLTALDVSNNMALSYLDATDNQLATLGVGAGTALIGLAVNNNQLTELAVNTILSDLAAASLDGAICDLSGGTNAAPTTGPPDGIAAIADMTFAGWDGVITNP